MLVGRHVHRDALDTWGVGVGRDGREAIKLEFSERCPEEVPGKVTRRVALVVERDRLDLGLLRQVYPGVEAAVGSLVRQLPGPGDEVVLFVVVDPVRRLVLRVDLEPPRLRGGVPIRLRGDGYGGCHSQRPDLVL